MTEKSKSNNSLLGAAIGALLGYFYAIENVRDRLDSSTGYNSPDTSTSEALIAGIGTDYVLMQMFCWAAWGIIIATIIVPRLVRGLQDIFASRENQRAIDGKSRKRVVVTQRKGPPPPN